MSNYIDLVLVKLDDDEPSLFYAPWMSRIKVGDVVIVDTLDLNPPVINGIGTKKAEVISVIEAMRGSDVYKFAMEATQTNILKRVIGRAIPYDYTDEETGD